MLFFSFFMKGVGGLRVHPESGCAHYNHAYVQKSLKIAILDQNSLIQNALKQSEVVVEVDLGPTITAGKSH